jgi:Icc-related predicted phosphoesterase
MRKVPESVRILAISDIELPKMQNVPYLRRTYEDVSFVISCGDLSVSYVEFITSILNVPLFFVRGNHDEMYEQQPPGGDDLHGRVIRYQGLFMAGLEGCRRYNKGRIQYSDHEMYLEVLKMAPGMLLRRARWGLGVDVMVTHASPFGIHDRPDRPHVGFRAFLLLMRWYRPRFLLHGHVDIWDRRDTTWTQYLDTQVVNINPVRLMTIEVQERILSGLSRWLRP